MISLLIVDDHALFRRGLAALLAQDGRFSILALAGDVGEALKNLSQQAPDVILLDNNLPGVRGVDGIPALKEAAPQARILMLTVSENQDDLAAALLSGAEGYLLKTVESDQLCNAIIKVMEGESVVSPEMMTKLLTVFRSKPSHITALAEAPAVHSTRQVEAGELSSREREVLACIARGASNKIIARELNIAETTVKIHVQHILRKLNLSSRVQAAVYASSLPET